VTFLSVLILRAPTIVAPLPEESVSISEAGLLDCPSCEGDIAHPSENAMRQGDAMKTPDTPEMSRVEQDTIARINSLRHSAASGSPSPLLNQPAHLMHYLIRLAHGHVKLRLHPIAMELGVEERTLERMFFAEFGKSMQQYQIETRVEFAKYLLSMDPPHKIIVIANLLGYDQTRDFVRFFQNQVHETPSSWGRAERARLREAERLADRRRKSS
jgi:AraC-like DNA-binding protein